MAPRAAFGGGLSGPVPGYYVSFPTPAQPLFHDATYSIIIEVISRANTRGTMITRDTLGRATACYAEYAFRNASSIAIKDADAWRQRH